MKRVQKYIALLIVTIAAIGSLPLGMRAQSTNQAALVLRHGQDDVRTACVDFDEPQISGYDLLQRSGAQLQLDVQGMGALVCRIDDTGCPPNDCLCQCKGGGDCIYWSYWHRLNGAWQYSQGGASLYMVEPGTIEGWSWGPGAVNQAVPPPDLTFEDVCQPAESETSTPSPTATQTQPPLLITPGAAETQDTSQAATATIPNSTATSSPTVPPTAAPFNTLTPTPFRQQTAATATPTQPPLLPDATLPVVLPTAAPAVETSADSTAQEVVEEGDEPLAETAVDVQPTLDAAEIATLAPAVVAQMLSPDTSAPTPFPNTKKMAAPTAEPTALLQVIGSGVVPTEEIDGGETGLEREDTGGIIGPESMPYLVFLLIMAGLAGLLGLISMRRRSKQS